MALITTPEIQATGQSLTLERADIPIELEGGATVIVQNTKALWGLRMPIRPIRIADARAWSAALVQLAKLSNTFEVYPPAWTQGAGYGGATPLVEGAAQLGLSLDCDGVTPSTTIALQGDFIEVEGVDEVKKLTADAVSDGTGAVTFAFEPALRQSPADNSQVNVTDPKIIMRLRSSEYIEDAQLSGHFNFILDAIEYFGP